MKNSDADKQDIPIAISEKFDKQRNLGHSNIKLFQLQDVIEEMNSKLTETRKLIIFYDGNNNRLMLVRNKKRNKSGSEIQEEAFFCGNKTNPPHLNIDSTLKRKFEKGMSSDDFLKVASQNGRCDLPIKVNGKKQFLACKKCWNQYMEKQTSSSKQIKWTEIELEEAISVNSIKKVFQLQKNKTTPSSSSLYFLADFYIQYENTLFKCSNCRYIAKIPANEYRRFTCQCKAWFVKSCCDNWHPPIPCRLYKRWNECNPKKNADDVKAWIQRNKYVPTKWEYAGEDGVDILKAQDDQHQNANICPRCDFKNEAEKPDAFEVLTCQNCDFRFCHKCQKQRRVLESGKYEDHVHEGPEAFWTDWSKFYFSEEFLNEYKKFDEQLKKAKSDREKLGKHISSKLSRPIRGLNFITKTQVEHFMNALITFRYTLMYLYVFNFYLDPASRDEEFVGNLESFKTDIENLSDFMKKPLCQVWHLEPDKNNFVTVLKDRYLNPLLRKRGELLKAAYEGIKRDTFVFRV